MKTVIRFFVIFACTFSTFIASGQPSFYLKLELAFISEDYLEVDIMISGSTNFMLGSSNIQFSFDPAHLADPIIDSGESTNLLGSMMYLTNLTEPGVGEASLNVYLFLPNFGNVSVPTFPSYTKLARVRFNVLDPFLLTNIQWAYNGGTTKTVIFLSDETTQIFVNTPPSDLIGISGIMLPVELLGFEARPLETSVLLNWETASEENFSGFEIQRSPDGIDFASIGWENASGSDPGWEYRFEDKEVAPNQTYYYRLKLLDDDQSYHYSEVRTARINRDAAPELLAYPNPSEGNLNIQVKDLGTPIEQIALFDLKGRQIQTFSPANLESGGVLQTDISSLPQGVYTLVLNTGTGIFSQRLVKL